MSSAGPDAIADDPAALAAAPPTPRLTVLPGGWCVPVAAGQTLLQAALAGGIRLPSACRNGSCRSCVARLLGGQVAYTIEWPGLLAEEKAEGWILPCVACARGDLVIEAPAASLLRGG